MTFAQKKNKVNADSFFLSIPYVRLKIKIMAALVVTSSLYLAKKYRKRLITMSVALG